MHRRTLDIVLATGGTLFAVLILVLGLVARNQANFAQDYVKQQLGEQKITFATAEKVTEEEKNWKSGSACLTKYAGQVMETGAQAECYANFYIAMHMARSAKTAGFEGHTYATIGGEQTALRAQITEAKNAKDDAKAAELQKKLDGATSLRETQFKGETLRGLLLTTYGFSIFGERAALAGTLCLAIAAIAILVSAAGFVHAFITPKEKLVMGGVMTPAAGK